MLDGRLPLGITVFWGPLELFRVSGCFILVLVYISGVDMTFHCDLDLVKRSGEEKATSPPGKDELVLHCVGTIGRQ